MSLSRRQRVHVSLGIAIYRIGWTSEPCRTSASERGCQTVIPQSQATSGADDEHLGNAPADSGTRVSETISYERHKRTGMPWRDPLELHGLIRSCRTRRRYLLEDLRPPRLQDSHDRGIPEHFCEIVPIVITGTYLNLLMREALPLNRNNERYKRTMC